MRSYLKKIGGGFIVSKKSKVSARGSVPYVIRIIAKEKGDNDAIKGLL